MNRATVLLTAMVFAALASACSKLPSSLQPYQDKAPQELLKAVDRQVYSPIEEGLTKLEATIDVDISGFYPKDARPADPVWVPVRLIWKQGQARFLTGKWPKELEPLKGRLMEFLAGKGDDLIRRSFGDVLEGYDLTLSATDDGNIVIHAVLPENTDRRIQLVVNERLLIPQMSLESEQTAVQSSFAYDAATPAHVTQITSQFSGNGQQTTVAVDFRYGTFGKYDLPEEVVYRIQIGTKKLPPFRMRVKEYDVAP